MITDEKVVEVLTKAIDRYGKDFQLNIAIEELSELQKEICKHKRGYQNRDHIIEEMVDVTIIMMELAMMFGVQDEELDEMLETKIRRLERNLEDEQYYSDWKFNC